MVSYKLRVRKVYINRNSDDVQVKIQAYLSGVSTGEPIISNGGIDYFNVTTNKSQLPSTGYAAFLTSLAVAAVDLKYSNTATGTGKDSSNTISGFSSVASLLNGLLVSGPGVPSNTLVSNSLNSNEIQVSNSLTRVYNGNAVYPSNTITGTLNSSQLVTDLSSTDSLFIGMSVAGTGVPSGTTVTKINSSSGVTLSNNATQTGSSALTFTTGQNTSFIYGLSPANLDSSFVGMNIAGTGVPLNTTIKQVISSSSIQVSNAIATGGAGSFTFSGATPFNFSTSGWSIDYSELQTVVTLINFGNL